MNYMNRTERTTLFLQLPPKERDRQFWTIQKVAIWLGLSPARVRQLADEDRIPAIKIFGRILIHIPTLKAMLIDAQGS